MKRLELGKNSALNITFIDDEKLFDWWIRWQLKNRYKITGLAKDLITNTSNNVKIRITKKKMIEKLES